MSQIFVEIGCIATRAATLKAARGSVHVDVVVKDKTQRPATLILCECKHWNRRVPKTVVHAFRTVVQDTGANLGFIISNSGFQSGARSVAAISNVQLVTWKEFQRVMYARWFAALENRLTRLADELFELADIDFEDKSCTLASEALSGHGEAAWTEFDRLKAQYFQIFAASTHLAPFAMRQFPNRGIDPRSTSPTTITFKSARMYFDLMFEAVPRAFKEIVAFLAKHTDGYCGSRELFDDAMIHQVVKNQTTMAEVRRLFGLGSIHRKPDGESWVFRASRTRFGRVAGNGTFWRIESAVTSYRTLTLHFADFRDSEVVRHVAVTDSTRVGLPRL